MVNHLPADDADTLREMLRRDVWHSCRHRDADITAEDIERSFKNLLDSHRLDVLENRYEMCKRIDDTNQQRAALVERERAALAAEVAVAEENAAFEQSILDRQKEDAENKKIPIKDLRRAALFGKDRVNGHLTTTPMPPSVKVVSKTL